jgi:hypothetical protein
MAMLLPVIGTVVSAAGTIVGAAASRQQSQAQAQMNEFRARQAKIAANEARAAAQREAGEKRREGALAQSKLQAQAAASGGGATDPTVMKLGERIAGRSQLSALSEMYKGESKARELLDQAALSQMAAAANRAEGNARQISSYFSAGGSLLSGLGSGFSRSTRDRLGERL